MLAELYIENLAVITAAKMEFSAGLNVITGETGAGKTILAQAIALLLGSRADTNLIRPGAGEASVEAVFAIPEGCFADLAEIMDIPEGDICSIRRRLSRDGRSRAFVDGRVANLAVLEQLAGRLLAFSAQHEQRRLMMAAHQLEILDSFCGDRLEDIRDEYRLLFDRRAAILGGMEEAAHDRDSRRREIDLLEFQIDEIEKAALRSSEEIELEKQRNRLARARELQEASVELAATLGASDDYDGGAMENLLQLDSRIDRMSGVDDDFDELSKKYKEFLLELQEIGRAARDYSGTLENDPAQLAEIEERLELISQLKRKYGNDIEEVLAFAESAARRLEMLQGIQQDRSALKAELGKVEGEMAGMAAELRRLRRKGAASLEEAAASQMEDLAFQDCGFEVRLIPLEGGGADMDPASMSASGADRVDFYVSLNPGMPAAPLKDTASGGELSRVMLAIKSAVSASGEVATQVFDEIDAGIGGETGAAVGAKLKGLASSSQIICITHLPQIACYADSHFSVIKDVSGMAGETVTEVARLDGKQAIGELCRMMGSRPEDEKARAHASSLIKKAAAT